MNALYTKKIFNEIEADKYKNAHSDPSLIKGYKNLLKKVKKGAVKIST